MGMKKIGLIIGSIVAVSSTAVFVLSTNSNPTSNLSNEAVTTTAEIQSTSPEPTVESATITPTPINTQTPKTPTQTRLVTTTVTNSPTPTPTLQPVASLNISSSQVVKGSHTLFSVASNYSLQSCHYRLIRSDGEVIGNGDVTGNTNGCTGSFVAPSVASFKLEVTATPNHSGLMIHNFTTQ